MIYNKQGLLVIDYSEIIKCKNYLTYLTKRITQDCDDINKSQNIINMLHKCKSIDEFTDILSDVYPKGVLYDNIIWKWNDYESVLFFLSKDDENLERIKKNKRNYK